MVSNIFNKVLGVCTAILGIFCLYFYLSLSNVRADRDLLEQRVTTLTAQNKSLTQSLESIQELKEAEDEIIKANKEASDSLSKDRDNTLNEIDKIVSTKTDRGIINDPEKHKENAVDDSLDPDLARVLNELCERVRRDTCPNP